jgi:hypothetical protein
MDFAGMNLEWLGAAALAFTILWLWNREGRIDLKEERKYSREITKLYQDSMLQSIDAFGKTTAALSSTKDALLRIEEELRRISGDESP